MKKIKYDKNRTLSMPSIPPTLSSIKPPPSLTTSSYLRFPPSFLSPSTTPLSSLLFLLPSSLLPLSPLPTQQPQTSPLLSPPPPPPLPPLPHHLHLSTTAIHQDPFSPQPFATLAGKRRRYVRISLIYR